MTVIIGFTGFAGCGKDTAYQLIRLFIEKGAERLAFADKLKDIANEMLDVAGFDMVARDGDRETKEDIRPLLVWLGEYARKQNESYWIEKVKPGLDYLVNAKCPMVVFTDVRYLNEAKFIMDKGGFIVYINAPVNPANCTEYATITEIFEDLKESKKFICIDNEKRSRKKYAETLENLIEGINYDIQQENRQKKTC